MIWSKVAVASVCHPRTLFSILTFVSFVRGLLSPASLNMRARATLREVVLLLRISAYKNLRALIDISKSPDECCIYPVMLYFLLIKSCKREIATRCFITVKFTFNHEYSHLDGKIHKAQVSGVPIGVSFDRKYITGGYRFIIGRF